MKHQLKKKFDLKKFLLIVLLGIGVLLIIDGLLMNDTPKEQEIICKFKPVYTNYQEELRFVYKNNKMYEYHQTETLKEADDVDKTLEEMYEFYVERGSDYVTNEDFKYEVTLNEDNVVSYTYLNVNKYSEKFDDYATNLYISHDLTVNELISSLEATNYNCEIK